MGTLITCATGFVSRAFVRSLRAEGERVQVLIRDKSKASWFSEEKVFVGDLFDPSCLRQAVRGVDTVIHVPPRVYPRGERQLELAMHRRAHVESTRLVLDAAVVEGARKFLFVSSAHATGRNPHKALCEADGSRPVTPYAQAKIEAEKLISSYARRYSMHAVILRPPGIYGPGDKSVVSSLRRAVERNLWLPLKGLATLHSLVFVDTLARAGLALLKVKGDGATSRIFIVKDREDYRPEELYTAVCQALGKGIRLFQAPLSLLQALAFVSSWLRDVPGIRGLSLLGQLMTAQRYCGHLFNETVPDFPYVGLNEALQSMLTKSSAV